jgi:hypothetical protein
MAQHLQFIVFFLQSVIYSCLWPNVRGDDNPVNLLKHLAGMKEAPQNLRMNHLGMSRRNRWANPNSIQIETLPVPTKVQQYHIAGKTPNMQEINDTKSPEGQHRNLVLERLGGLRTSITRRLKIPADSTQKEKETSQFATNQSLS